MQRNRGFTLIEAMVVLAIIALTLTVGLPSFAGVMERQRVSTTMHLLSADMAMARNTAIMRRQQVMVCPGTQAGCGSDSDWSAGWIVFHDPDQDRKPGNPSEVLRIQPPSASKLTLTSSRRYLRYQADGRSANTNLTVRVCADGALRGKVIVNNMGRVRSERPAGQTACEGG